MDDKVRHAAAEVIAAYREHQAMLLVGGHKPKRVDSAVDALATSLDNSRRPQDA